MKIFFLLSTNNVPPAFLPTGFSFGGLLACAIASHVWDSDYIQSSLLKENLVCITFAQPHIPVPGLPEVAIERPDLVSTIHTVYWEGDLVPRLSRFLNECCSSLGSEGKHSLRLGIQSQPGLVQNVLLVCIYVLINSLISFHSACCMQPYM